MDVEKLPTLAAADLGSVDDPRRPVLSMDWSAQGPHRVPGHSHPRAQIIFQCAGVYRVATESGNFVVPPQQAIWIPSHVYHETFTNDSARALMLFVDYSLAQTLSRDCMVVDAEPLLVQLFHRAVQYGNYYLASSREARLVQVILDELGGMRPAPLQLPLAMDKRLRRLMDRLLENPALDLALEDLADATGASCRTLARLFRSETGMTFVEWRNQLRLLEAIDRLGQGQPVTRVALETGYHSPSAFIAMFRRCTGESPTGYMKRRAMPAAMQPGLTSA